MPFVAAPSRRARCIALYSSGVSSHGLTSSTVNVCFANGARLCRERLRRPGLLAGHVALRHRTLLDRPERLAGHAVEHIQETGLARVRHGVDAAAVVAHGDELRRRHVVEIPEIVMHGLEMPEPFAGARVERQQAVGEEIRAVPIRAVEIVGRRSGRDVDDAALLVDRHRAPVVRAAGVLVGVLRPGLVAELAGHRDGVKLPDLLPVMTS